MPAQPPVLPFITNTPPRIRQNSENEPMIGQGIGCGT